MITTELSVGAWSYPSVLQHQNFSTVRIILLRFWSFSMSSGPAWQSVMVSGSAKRPSNSCSTLQLNQARKSWSGRIKTTGKGHVQHCIVSCCINVSSVYSLDDLQAWYHMEQILQSFGFIQTCTVSIWIDLMQPYLDATAILCLNASCCWAPGFCHLFRLSRQDAPGRVKTFKRFECFFSWRVLGLIELAVSPSAAIPEQM